MTRRRQSALIVSGIAFLALHLSPLPVMGAQRGEGAGGESALPQESSSIEAQLDFRRLIGFRAGEPFVRDLNAHPERHGASSHRIETYGHPMTGPERIELRIRRELEAEAATIKQYGEEHSDSFAGSYLDQRGGGLMRVGFTRDVEHHIEQLAGRMSRHPDRLRGFSSEFTEEALRATKARVLADAKTLIQEGVKLAMVSTATSRNRTVVGVTDVTAEQRAMLQDRYGPSVVVTEHAGALGDHYPHADPARAEYFAILRGGLKLDSTDTLSGCSSAFVAFDVFGMMSLQYYLLTAGHCYNQGDLAVQGNDTIGSVERRAFDWAGNADGAAIRIDPSRISRWVYVHPAAQAWQIPRWQSKALDQEGHIVCIAGMLHPGAHAEQNCGAITDTDAAQFYANYDNTLIVETRTVSFGATARCTSGDSGAAWYSADVAVGVHGGHGDDLGGDPICFYSHIDNVLSNLGLSGVWPK